VNGTLRLGSDDALYMLIGKERFSIRPEEIRPLLFFGRAVPVTGEGTAIVGHAVMNPYDRAVKVFTVAGHFIVPLVSFRRVVAGEAVSAPLFPLVPEGFR